MLRKLCEYKGVEIIEAEACKDHIHMLVSILPKYSVSQIMGYLKGKSSLMIFEKYANMKYKYNTNIPQYAIERVARCVFDDIRAAYEDEEIQREFAEWQAEQAAKKAELKLHKNTRATVSAALVVYFSFFFFGPRGLDSGRIFQPFAK